MKRRQKRYTSEAMLLRAIDKQKSNLAKIRVRIATQTLTDEQVLAMNKEVKRIEDSTLPNLKRALAAFNTMLLPGITNDPAVVIR